jgi:hypothetical protein
MMQLNEIIGLMEGTIPFSNKSLDRLSNLLDKYPYFQTAHLLHTLNLLHLKNTYFLFDLRKTAIYMPDRKQLFFQIENEFFTPELIEALEKGMLPLDTSFDLIDSFLSQNGEFTDLDNIDLDSSPVSIDYTSYFLSDKTENEETPPLQFQETIDKFLENGVDSPIKITLDQPDEPEPEEEQPENFPESPDENTFFSETLAKIYIKQRKYDKALEVIRKLNLIYPEKSCYFADQIRFLEKLIINTNKI